jgi:two-component system invasion response regulator UvrY
MRPLLTPALDGRVGFPYDESIIDQGAMQEGETMIRVLVVDDHELVRIGLRQVLADYPHIRIAGEAGDGETALRLNREIRPDIALLDICLPGLSGFEITTRMKQTRADLGIIILSVHERAPYPERMLEAGASGYLSKGCPATELVQAIRTVARGGRHIGSRVAQSMALNILPGGESSPFDGLSPREMEVLLMLADGKKVADIAHTMHLSPKTVATYKYRIYDKLNTRNDVDVARMAMRYGVVASS